jgi:AcrR family transcriptional regulator
MVKENINKRARLAQAAVKMAHRQGFSNTSLADIAKEAKVPLGNVYYYFKTKEELGDAIIQERLTQISTASAHWDQIDSPQERLCACIDAVLEEKDNVARDGCPLGTLSCELRKERGALGTRATRIFATYLDWLEAQFRLLGKKSEARALAVHLLSALQGASLLAHSLRDPSIVATETKRLKGWIRSL